LELCTRGVALSESAPRANSRHLQLFVILRVLATRGIAGKGQSAVERGWVRRKRIRLQRRKRAEFSRRKGNVVNKGDSLDPFAGDCNVGCFTLHLPIRRFLLLFRLRLPHLSEGYVIGPGCGVPFRLSWLRLYNSRI